MKKAVIIILVLAILTATGVYFFGNSSDLQGRFNGRIKTNMEAESADELKAPPINGMESESADE